MAERKTINITLQGRVLRTEADGATDAEIGNMLLQAYLDYAKDMVRVHGTTCTDPECKLIPFCKEMSMTIISSMNTFLATYKKNNGESND